MAWRKGSLAIALTIATALAGATAGHAGSVPVPASSASAAASMDRFVIEKRISPAFDGRSFGKVGPYEVLVARAYMSIDPAARINLPIAELDTAPRDSRGRVTYSTQVTILKPVDRAKGSGNLFYEVINRSLGGIDPQGKALDKSGLFDVLMARGDVIVNAAWQADLTPEHPLVNLSQFLTLLGGEPIYADLPPAMSQGQPLVRRIRFEAPAFDSFGAKPLKLAKLDYAAAGSPDLKAYWRRFEADEPKLVPSERLRWVDPYTIAIEPVPGAATYDFVYNATGSRVAGVGLAVPRDVIAFLRHANGSSGNPLVGVGGRPSVKHAFAMGLSQSGRYLRHFLYYGFNEDARGGRVFDGVLPVLAGGRGGFFNQLFATPGLIPGEMTGHRSTTLFPFAYPVLDDPVSGTRDGLLRRCEESNTCPKIMQVDSENEGLMGWGWLLTTAPDGKAITRQPQNVRLYAFSGGDHSGSRASSICRGKAAAPVRWQPYVRAALVNLVQWAGEGKEPPPSRYYSLHDGTLTTVERAQASWPAIPGYPFVSARNVPEHWTAGTPLPVSQGRYPVLAATMDKDGNALGGIRDPLLAVPEGTLSGTSVRKDGFGAPDPCPMTGEYIPFAQTAEARRASGDPRLSLAERYPRGSEEIAEKRRAVARNLVKSRYVLAQDEARVATGWSTEPAP